jgi:hypothetical protein
MQEALRTLRQEDHEFKIRFDYTVRPYLKKQDKANKQKKTQRDQCFERTEAENGSVSSSPRSSGLWAALEVEKGRKVPLGPGGGEPAL